MWPLLLGSVAGRPQPSRGKVLGRLTPLPYRGCRVGCSHWVLPAPTLARYPQFPKGEGRENTSERVPKPRQVGCHEPGASVGCWAPSALTFHS